MHPSSLEIQNPEHQISPNILETLNSRYKARRELLDLQNEIGGATELNEEYANARRDIYRSALAPLNIDIGKAISGLTEAKLAFNDKVGVSTQRLIDIKHQRAGVKLSDVDKPLKPTPTDPSFWWARTQAWSTSGHTIQSLSDGLHFTGGPKLDKWNVERHESFGAIATFALQFDRIPPAPFGRWISSPFVELFGGVVVFAPDWDPLQGNGMASCDMYLRQTLYQFGIAMEGSSNEIIRGEAVSDGSWLISLENTGYSQSKSMPGHQDIPSVSLARTDISVDTLFADIEVRFDIHLKSAGALVWCDPEVILRTFQWPLLAKAW
jgi:hypothetical protein